MLITPAYAQAAGGGTGNPMTDTLVQLLPLVFILVIFYFLLIRPQQRRMKAHQQMISALKKGDTVITSGGLIGKVRSVADDEVRVELGPNVEVRVVRSTISEVRGKGDPAPANDSKPAATE
ncbi:MAG: preprotein translocase subunit YajC [Alphaproteobacteria bacterium]|nr:preprotein translocase subunit YajC [Alphaproteobacteria bacterium]